MKIVSKNNFPDGSNVINSHTLYKVKKDDNESLKLKAKITPHENEDNVIEQISQKFYCMFFSYFARTGIDCVFKKGNMYVAHVRSTFLQTRLAE